MKFTQSLLLASIMTAGAIALPASAATEAKAREMMEVTGVTKLMDNMLPAMVDAMTKNMQQTHPGLPSDVPQIIGKVVKEVILPLVPQMTDEMVKVYSANLTDEEIDASLAFYRTENGQHILQKMPLLAQKGMEVGQRVVASHMSDLQMRLQAELKAAHPELK